MAACLALSVAPALTQVAGAHTALARHQVRPGVLTDEQVAAMSPGAQASLLAPLRRLADVLDALGSEGWRSSYSGVRLDAAHDLVDVFTSDAHSGHALLEAARRVAPDARWARVRIRQAAYSRTALDAAAARIITGPHRADLRAVSVAADGSGLDIETADGGLEPRGVPAGLPVAVHVRAGLPRAAKSWADDKWHDSSPYIGGDALTTTGSKLCTAGLPAVRRADLIPVLITAAHCFATGQRVYTRGGRTGAFSDHRTGNFVGTVGTRNTHWDSEPLTGTRNVSAESDTYGAKPLTSLAYSYVGDYVCQDGAASYFLGHPTPCGIKVTKSDIYFSIGGHVARGVEGVDVRTGWGSHNGDSGATVFAIEPHNNRQARGIVSSGGLDGTRDQKRVDWVEAVDIFNAYHLKLNPKTTE